MHVGKTLISKSTESAINIASTKSIMQDLMLKEKAYDNDPRNTKDTQGNDRNVVKFTSQNFGLLLTSKLPNQVFSIERLID